MDSIADWQFLILRPQFQTAGVFLYFHIFLNILDTFSYLTNHFLCFLIEIKAHKQSRTQLIRLLRYSRYCVLYLLVRLDAMPPFSLTSACNFATLIVVDESELVKPPAMEWTPWSISATFLYSAHCTHGWRFHPFFDSALALHTASESHALHQFYHHTSPPVFAPHFPFGIHIVILLVRVDIHHAL